MKGLVFHQGDLLIHMVIPPTKSTKSVQSSVAGFNHNASMSFFPLLLFNHDLFMDLCRIPFLEREKWG